MPWGYRPFRWLAGGLVLLASCVESGRAADVHPELVSGARAATLAPRGVSPTPARHGKPVAVGSTALAAAAVAGVVPRPEDIIIEVPRFEVDGFFGTPDEPVRTALSQEEPVKFERGRGGRSLGFKITLASGQKGYFKGEQEFSAANWFGEVASFHLDRMLGMGRVPTVVSRSFAWSKLAPAAGADKRKSEMIIKDGQVRGAFVAWIDGALKPLVQIDGWERWIRVKFWPSTAVSPFQRPAVWKNELVKARRGGNDWRSKEERYRRRSLKPVPDREDRPAELSDLVIFDYLTRNIDRWGGGNTNVLTRSPGGELVFLDNGASFEPGEVRPSLMEARLHVVQRFRRRTIDAIRAFDLAKFEARLASEPVQPVLTRAQLSALEARRKALLEWVEEQEQEHGEAIWAWE
jgi:hypothetical protein